MMRLLPILVLVPFALVAEPPSLHAQDADPAAATFNESCARCHRDAAELADMLAADPEAVPALDRFLARHHAPDEGARRAVIDYLLRLADG